MFAKNDRIFNNRFFGGGTFALRQDLADFSAEISKQSVSGASFALRHTVDYDANNAPQNLFPSAWQSILEGEFRLPLMQGAGVEFNRIAGPRSTPGVYNGVLIARTNHDASIAEFELSVRDFVSNVENAYWDLYFAYRDLQARIDGRDRALATWRDIKARFDSGKKGGEADKEAQAREQYFRFQEEVENALVGRPVERTRTNNGSSGGTFRAVGGVYAAERRLRLLVGLPASDGRLIRTSEDPVAARYHFDWPVVLQETLSHRPELRRQRAEIERACLELTAAKNFLLPRLDTIGRYRFRGFGDDLLDPDRDGIAEFDNAYANLTGGDFQEWETGIELNLPIGYRREHAAVRNAQLQVARQRTLLGEQERHVAHDLASAMGELDRAWAVSQTALLRRKAARDELDASQAAYDADRVSLEVVLDAQGRLSEAESNYYRALLEYAVALKNVHFEKGSLLEYRGVALAGDCVERPHAPRLPAGNRPLNYTLEGPAPSAHPEVIGPTTPEPIPPPPPSLTPPGKLRAPAPESSPAPQTGPALGPMADQQKARYASYYDTGDDEPLAPGVEALPKVAPLHSP
jgi:outer membrane protein TolC